MEESVIATEENRKLLSSECVIYLKVSIPAQLERMKGGRTPLLSIADMKAFLDKQHLERDHLFEEIATLTIDSISVEEDVNKIMNCLSNKNMAKQSKEKVYESFDEIVEWYDDARTKTLME